MGCLINKLEAQENTKNNFHITPQVNLLNGNSNVSSSISIELSKQYKMFHYGISMGVDYYKFRTAPITLQIKHFLNTQRNKPFVYAGVGYNIAWLLEKEKMQTGWSWWGGGENEFATYKGGLAYNFGVGYLLQNTKQKGLIISLGINSKSLTEQYTDWVFNGVDNTQMPRSKTYNFTRLSLGVGFMF